MLKGTASVLMLSFLLISAFALVLNVKQANSDWTGTVYIRADGRVDPPDAPIKRDGNVYTLTDYIGSSANGIVIERDNIVLDGAGSDGSDGRDVSISITLKGCLFCIRTISASLFPIISFTFNSTFESGIVWKTSS